MASLGGAGERVAVVNSIGGFLLGEAVSARPGDLRVMVDVSPGAALWLSQAVEPSLQQRGSGAIVHVSARPGTDPTASMAAYSLSKAALSHLVRILDLELRPHGIQVNAVARTFVTPPVTRTVFPAEVLARCPAGSGRGHRRLPRQRPRRTRQRCGRASLRRLARPDHTLPPPCI
jgi:3-oxoacyl-[acyl-carrier protein] reductase